MWVLVYLISLIAGLKDRRKIWWLVGTFVLSSGILYFLFMTAWLNTFLLVGYIRVKTHSFQPNGRRTFWGVRGAKAQEV